MAGINLRKGQPVGLNNTNGQPLNAANVSATWATSANGSKGLVGAFKKRRGTDLDLVAIAFQERTPICMIGGGESESFCGGALKHSGDDRKGNGGESITMELERLVDEVDTVVFMLGAYADGVTFSNVQDVQCKVADKGGTEVGHFFPSIVGTENNIILAVVKRLNDGWTITTINEMARGQGKQSLCNLASRYINH